MNSIEFFIGRVMGYFTCETRSLPEFVDIITKKGCRTVVMRPYRIPEDGDDSLATGRFVSRQYLLKVAATTRLGREVSYEAKVFEHVEDDEKARITWLKHLLLTEKKARHLQRKLPRVVVEIISPEGELMTNTSLAEFHREVKRLGVPV